LPRPFGGAWITGLAILQRKLPAELEASSVSFVAATRRDTPFTKQFSRFVDDAGEPDKS
jgi:hypothetical protein